MHSGIKAAGDLIFKGKCSINTSKERSDTPGNKSLDSCVNIRGEIRSIDVSPTGRNQKTKAKGGKPEPC